MKNKLLFVIMTILVGFLLTGCTRPDSTRKFLVKQGYKDVEITGYRWFMRSQNESFSTGFKAVNPNGVAVSGAVTEGWLFRGKTLRFD